MGRGGDDQRFCLVLLSLPLGLTLIIVGATTSSYDRAVLRPCATRAFDPLVLVFMVQVQAQASNFPLSPPQG